MTAIIIKLSDDWYIRYFDESGNLLGDCRCDDLKYLVTDARMQGCKSIQVMNFNERGN